MEREPPRRKCPWCAEPEGCRSCSFSGDDPSTYVLVSEAYASERVRAATSRSRWVIALLGGAVAALVALLAGVLFGLAWL